MRVTAPGTISLLDADPDLRSPEAEVMAEEARRMFGEDVEWLTRA